MQVLQLHVEGDLRHKKRFLKPETLAELHRVQYPGHSWFGFQNQSEPHIFGHAGIDTVIGVADPVRKLALFFSTTNSPKPQERVAPLRNGITDRVFSQAPT